MAQRKPPAGKPSNPARGTGARSSAGRMSDAAASKAASGRSGTRTATKAAAPATTSKGGGKRPPSKKGKSIVNQKQTPWGLIASAVAVVVLAAVVVVAVVHSHKSSSSSAKAKSTVSVGGQAVDTTGKDTYRQAALPAAMAIKGVVHHVEGLHEHVPGLVSYDTSPPTGGDHSQIWAQCTGVVYTHQLANENAVHSMEHGGVWVTYNPADLSKAQVAALAKDVSGVDRVFMTPYKGLKTPVSLQAWGYQLFVPSSTDPRIEQFIKLMSTSTASYPEQGATCSDPYWKSGGSASKPGSPQEQ